MRNRGKKKKRNLAGGLPEIADLQMSPCTPVKAEEVGEKSPTSTPASGRRQPRLPSGDSPFVRAKRAQLVDKDLNKAIPLYWAAINSGDRVDSALKDMVSAMIRLNRPEEAIEAIKSFRSQCSLEAQDHLDNFLLELYKKCRRIKDLIELLNLKLKMIEEGLAFGRRTTKLVCCRGKKIRVSINEEKSRLLGELAWAYMQSDDYKEAEILYRKSLAVYPNINEQCKLAICLMKTGRVEEAESLIQDIKKPSPNSKTRYYFTSFEQATEMLSALKSQTGLFSALQEEKSTPISTNTRHVGSSTPISPCGREDKGLTIENSNSSQLATECSLPSSCSQNLSDSVTPPSEIRKEGLDHCHLIKGTFSDVAKRRFINCSHKAFLSPVPADENRNLEPQEPCTVSESCRSREHSGSSSIYPGKEIDISREVKDDNVKTEITQESQNPVGIPQAIATRETTNSLKAAEEGSSLLSSKKMRKKRWRRKEAPERVSHDFLPDTEGKVACQTEKEEQSQISGNADATSTTSTDTRHVGSSTPISPYEREDKGLTIENSSSSQLAIECSLPSSCSQDLSNSVTPPSEIRKEGLDHCHLSRGTFADIGKRMLINCCHKAFLSPVPAYENRNLEPQEPCTVSGSCGSREHSGSSSIYQGKEIEISREVKDDNVKAEITQEPQNPVDIPQAIATRESTNSLKAAEEGNSLLSSKKMRKKRRRRKRVMNDFLPDTEGKVACQTEKEEQSQISGNAYATNTTATKPEAENSLIVLATTPKIISDCRLSVCMDMSYDQGSDISAETTTHPEKIQVESPMNDDSHNSNNSSLEEKIEARSISKSRTWADMVEEEESISNENEESSAAFYHSSRSCNGKDLKPKVHSWQSTDTEALPDENANSDIVMSAPEWKQEKSLNFVARACRKSSMVNLKEDSEIELQHSRNKPVKRSLLFDQQPN